MSITYVVLIILESLFKKMISNMHLFGELPKKKDVILKLDSKHLMKGWEGDARGRRCGDMCMCIADSLCYTAETNTPL